MDRSQSRSRSGEGCSVQASRGRLQLVRGRSRGAVRRRDRSTRRSQDSRRGEPVRTQPLCTTSVPRILRLHVPSMRLEIRRAIRRVRPWIYACPPQDAAVADRRSREPPDQPEDRPSRGVPKLPRHATSPPRRALRRQDTSAVDERGLRYI